MKVSNFDLTFMDRLLRLKRLLGDLDINIAPKAMAKPKSKPKAKPAAIKRKPKKAAASAVKKTPSKAPKKAQTPAPAPVKKGPTLKEMLAMLDKREPNKPLRKKGRCTFLYIPDMGTNKGTKKDATPQEWSKVHLLYCDVLQKMEDAGRDDRYEVSEATNGEFSCVYNDGKKTKKRLNVCRYCTEALEHPARYGSYKNFNFAAFAKEHNFQGMPEELMKKV